MATDRQRDLERGSGSGTPRPALQDHRVHQLIAAAGEGTSRQRVRHFVPCPSGSPPANAARWRRFSSASVGRRCAGECPPSEHGFKLRALSCNCPPTRPPRLRARLFDPDLRQAPLGHGGDGGVLHPTFSLRARQSHGIRLDLAGRYGRSNPDEIVVWEQQNIDRKHRSAHPSLKASTTKSDLPRVIYSRPPSYPRCAPTSVRKRVSGILIAFITRTRVVDQSSGAGSPPSSPGTGDVTFIRMACWLPRHVAVLPRRCAAGPCRNCHAPSWNSWSRRSRCAARLASRPSTPRWCCSRTISFW